MLGKIKFELDGWHLLFSRFTAEFFNKKGEPVTAKIWNWRISKISGKCSHLLGMYALGSRTRNDHIRNKLCTDCHSELISSSRFRYSSIERVSRSTSCLDLSLA